MKARKQGQVKINGKTLNKEKRGFCFLDYTTAIRRCVSQIHEDAKNS